MTPHRFFARDGLSSEDEIDAGYEERGNQNKRGGSKNFRPMTQINPEEIFMQVKETNMSSTLENMDFQNLTQFILKITRSLYVNPQLGLSEFRNDLIKF
jgi:hypothetical protein